MEEARQHRGELALAIVDKGIQNARLALLRQDIEVGNGRRNQRTMPRFQQHLISRTSHMDHAIALDAHRDDKAVIFAQVAVEWFRYLHHPHIEIRGVDDLRGSVGRLRIHGTIVLLHMEVERLSRQFRMELTRFPVEPRTVVVKDPVGHIRRLLHLSQKDSAADGMHTAGRQIEHVARRTRPAGR